MGLPVSQYKAASTSAVVPLRGADAKMKAPLVSLNAVSGEP
jgi:hypothetical protein